MCTRMRRLVRTVTATLIGALLVTAAPQHASAQLAPNEADLAEKGRNFTGALMDSLKLVSMEHALRIAFQEKTRSELGGPFWSDYKRSVRWPRQWEDTDAWGVNYIGHPIHGAGAGMIWLDHSDKDRAAAIFGKGYLSSRAKASAFAAIYSLQFEIGPLSEASIGNVGMDPSTTGWVDHVVTPVGAFGFMIAEDALDYYVMRWFERKVQNRAARATLRLVLGPSRFLANSAEGRLPWYRPDRPLSDR